jgi:transketolase
VTDLTHLRRQMLELAHKSGEGHVPSSLSVLDIIWVLYNRVMRPQDRLILSKGHGCLALYCVLAEKGILPAEVLDTFCMPGSKLLGHPERNLDWGIEATTGSLGHGLPMAVGLAMALKIQKSDARVYCLVGDSEMEEGSCFEAAHIAAHHNLTNLTLLIDYNKNSPNDIGGKIGHVLIAIGWRGTSCDGHRDDAIFHAIDRNDTLGVPWFVGCHTIKGHGVLAMEADPRAWHHRVPSAAELARMIT